MTIDTQVGTATASPDMRTVLFGSTDSDAAIAEALREHRAVEAGIGGAWVTMSHAIRDLLIDQVAHAASGFLSPTVGEALASGLRSYVAIVDAARESLESTGPCLVDLAGVTVSSTWRPAVEVLLGGLSAGRLDFEVGVEINLTTLAAVLERGAIVRLTTGSCAAVGRLLASGRTLASRTVTFDPKLAMDLGAGLIIASSARHR